MLLLYSIHCYILFSNSSLLKRSSLQLCDKANLYLFLLQEILLKKFNICIQGRAGRFLSQLIPKQVQGSASHKRLQSQPPARPLCHVPSPNQCQVIYGAERAEFLESNSFPREARQKRFDCKFIFIVSRSQLTLETWSRYKPTTTILEDLLLPLAVMTSACSFSVSDRRSHWCPKLLKIFVWFRLQLAWAWHNFGQTCFELHFISVPMCLCVLEVWHCINRSIYGESSPTPFNATVCLPQGPENLWQFKLSKWIFICIHYVFTFMAGPASVGRPDMGQRCQQCWLLHCMTPLSIIRVDWLIFDNLLLPL